MAGQPIDKFLSYKDPHCDDTRIVFNTHVVMSDGEHLLISDVVDTGAYKIDETLVFRCNENGKIKEWIDVQGARYSRTDDVIKMLNNNGYYKHETERG